MSKNRIPKTDKYDGTKEAKERLINLFLFTRMNIVDFVNASHNYRKYFVKTLNAIEDDRKKDCIVNYSDISNRVLKITEIDNVFTLTRLLFNALSAFDAFLGYILNEVKKITYAELQKLVTAIKPLLNAKTIDTNQDFDLGELLHCARNAYVHSGDFVCKYSTVPSGQEKVLVPALIIMPSQVFNADYCKKHNIDNDYFIDTYEVFNNYLKVLNSISIDTIL